MRVNIYVLIDPLSCKIRYIGRTKNGLNTRLIGHLSKSKNKQTHKDYWIQSILKVGLVPKIKLFKIVYGWSNSYKIEQELISKGIKFGLNLTNSHDRGEGGVNRIVTKEQKQKISNSLKKGYVSGKIKPSRITSISIFTLKGIFIRSFNSCSECVKKIKIPQSSLEKVLAKKVKRWKSYQITYGEKPGKYKINKRDISILNKKVYILKIDNKETLEFPSFKLAAKFLKVSSPTIRRYIESGLIYKHNYFISNARLKQEELLENPTLERQKEDNQQPSLLSNEFEGSTTNSRIQTDNAEDSNANTSILQSKRLMI